MPSAKDLDLRTVADFEALSGGPHCDLRSAYGALLGALRATVDRRLPSLHERYLLARFGLEALEEKIIRDAVEPNARSDKIVRDAKRTAKQKIHEANTLLRQLEGSRDPFVRKRILHQLDALHKQFQALMADFERASSAYAAGARRIEVNLPELSVAWRCISTASRLESRLLLVGIWNSIRAGALRLLLLASALALTILADRAGLALGAIGGKLVPSEPHAAGLLLLFAAQVVLLEPVMRKTERCLFSRSQRSLIASARSCLGRFGEAEISLAAAELKLAELAKQVDLDKRSQTT